MAIESCPDLASRDGRIVRIAECVLLVLSLRQSYLHQNLDEALLHTGQGPTADAPRQHPSSPKLPKAVRQDTELESPRLRESDGRIVVSSSWPACPP